MANIKIIIERLRSSSSELPSRKNAPRGIIARQFEDELYGRRRAGDDDTGDDGGSGGTPRAAPVLTVNHYRNTVVSSGVYSGYGYTEHHRFNAAFVDTSRPFAQKLQFEVSLNSDFSAPFQTNELNYSSSPTGFNSFLCDRHLTCIGENDGGGTPLYLYGIHGTTQFVRARDFDGLTWSEWGSVNLVYLDDYATPPEYPLSFTDRCN